MAFETVICEECPTPIQWQQLRKAYLRMINIALEERDKKLKEQDAVLLRVAEFASALRALFLAEDTDISVREYKKLAERVKRAASAVSTHADSAAAMQRAERKEASNDGK